MKSGGNPGSQIDWALIDRVDPVSLKTDQGLGTMRLICQQFLETTTVPLDQPTRVLKLFQILQVIVGYFCTCQDMLNQKVEELSSGKREVVGIVGVQCPICMKVFESLTFLDKHIFNRHGEVAHFWQNFRTPPLPVVPMSDNLAQYRGRNEEQFQWLFDKLRKEMKRERKERQKEINSLIKRKVSKVENKIENLQTTLKDPLAHTQPIVQYIPQAVPQPIPTNVDPPKEKKKAPKKRRKSLRRYEAETSPIKLPPARPQLVIDEVEPLVNIACEEERPSKPIPVITRTTQPVQTKPVPMKPVEEKKPKHKKRKKNHSPAVVEEPVPSPPPQKQKEEPPKAKAKPAVRVEKSTVKPKPPIKIPEEKPKSSNEPPKPLLKYQTQAPAPIDVTRGAAARQIDFDEYNESQSSTEEVIRVSKPALVSRKDYQVTQTPVRISKVSGSAKRPFGLVDSETSQTMGTSTPMASPTIRRNQFQVVSGVSKPATPLSMNQSQDPNAFVTDDIDSEDPATPVQVSINIARYSPAPCMYSVTSISSDPGSPRSPRRSTIVIPDDELIVSESLS